jgi:membrane-associated protease RseP (regulator of RpoE activity)
LHGAAVCSEATPYRTAFRRWYAGGMERPDGNFDGAELEAELIRWRATIAGGATQAGHRLSVATVQRPRSRRVFLPVFLFVATCLSTFIAGALDWDPATYLAGDNAGRKIAENWQQGAIYAAAVVGILLTHEMGHFVQTVRYGVPASLPFFIPVPFLVTGTMGAVIGMEGARADRKQLFDIGISGPWAGLLVALPITWFGIQNATAMKGSPPIVLGDPLIFKLMTHYLRPDIAADAILRKNNPLLMAGWVGMLITGLNMLPISQLDGGHVIYGLFGRSAKWIARGFMILAILFIVVGEHYNWSIMLIIVILLGVDHPPTRDDNVRLGWKRWAFGFASLTIPVLCFTPVQLS